MHRLSIIVALAENGVIGQGRTIPWREPEDMKLFKALTTGHAIIMGRKTWETLPRALPGRRNIVLTANPGFRADGAEVCQSLDQALKLVEADDEPFVIGGSAVYAQAIPLANRLYMTYVAGNPQGDVFWPGMGATADRWILRTTDRLSPTAELKIFDRRWN